MTKISQKVLVVLLAVSLIPLGLVSAYWYHTAQASLRTEAESRQKLMTQSDVYRVNQYVTDKVNALIIHSQATTVQAFDISGATNDLEGLVKQDSDIQSVQLATKSGQVVINLARTSRLPTGANISSSDAFRATTYLAGKEYIGPVTYGANNHPMVTIAAPLVRYTTGQVLSNLSTADAGQIRTPDEIFGVLIETVDLTNLWKTVFTSSGSMDGYAFVVDSQGALIGYPDSSFALSHPDISRTKPVAAFLANPNASPHPAVMTSERGTPVLSSYAAVPRTDWGVISEVPLGTVFASANTVARVGVTLLALVALAVVVLAYIVSRRMTTPIKQLAAGAEQISRGNLDTRISLRSRDEVGMLARAFNAMASNLSVMLHRAEAESTKANVILNNVNEGILALDEHGNIVTANIAAASLAAEMPQSLMNQPLERFYAWTMNGQPFRPSLTDIGVYQEITLTNTQKRVHQVDVLVNPITADPSGIRCIMTIQDKTGERELENMRVDFVSMAAHELRTPMTAIRGYLDLIEHEKGFKPNDTIQDYLSHITASSTELIGLINNLLNVSRIERNALTLSRDKIDWVAQVQKAIADLQFSAQAKGLTLTYEGPAKDVYIYADALAVGEIINNLVSNAINHTLEGGKIIVRVAETPEAVQTSVIDNGVGISRENQQYLFTKFYRARSSLTSGSGGTGLGLFISRSIAEMHGGTISVESEEGKGSTFTLKLPLFDEERYTNEVKRRVGTVKNTHGWIIKNTARRR